MSRPIKLSKFIYGRLTILKLCKSHIQPSGSSVTIVLCVCKCGNRTKVRLNSLKSGRTKSCGCLHKEKWAKRITKHDDYQHPLYKVWSSMKARCYNKNHKSYNYYGKRGIKIYKLWLHKITGFRKFRDFSIKNGWKKGLQIDRINNNGNYVPSNIRFVPHSQNQRNKNNNVYIIFKRKNYLLIDAVEKYGIVDYQSALRRIKQGWTVEKAILTPFDTRGGHYEK